MKYYIKGEWIYNKKGERVYFEDNYYCDMTDDFVRRRKYTGAELDKPESWMLKILKFLKNGGKR